MAMAGREQWIAAGSSEIILEGFVFSLALPTVLFIYSAGIPNVSLIPLQEGKHYFVIESLENMLPVERLPKI